VQELRAAQDYIAYLQHELHAITDVVHQLREKPEPRCVRSDPSFRLLGARGKLTLLLARNSPHALEQYPSALQQRRAGPQVSEQEQVEQTAQAAFEVVKVRFLLSLSAPLSLDALIFTVHSH